MSDPQNRWTIHARRWALTAIAACLLLAVANHLVINQPLYHKAAKVRIGQSLDEVRATMGVPDSWRYRRQSPDIDRFYYGPLQNWWDWSVVLPFTTWLSRWGYSWNNYFREDDYPVVIRFDANQRVSRVRYGRTVVEESLHSTLSNPRSGK